MPRANTKTPPALTRPMRVAGKAALCITLALTVMAAETPTPEPARPADSLVETIGVATHWGFHNTVYHQKWAEVSARLGQLGVRYIRDSLDPRMDDLWKHYGIRAIAIAEPTQSWDKYRELWTARRHLIAAIEGPNEVNGSWAKLGLLYEGKTWPEGPRRFQDDLFKQVRDTPELSGIAVIALSTAYKGAGTALAPLRSFDHANAHSYAGGAMPSQSLDFRDSYLLIGKGAVCPPLVATESGYHTCLGSTKVIAAAQSGVSHAAHRKYIPRHVAEYFNAGFRWTVIYELAAGRPKKAEQEDPEAAFGLLMPDGSPKPAYFALQDMVALLAESRWDAVAGRWIRPDPPPPRALAFALDGAPASLHHTLLQRADGSSQLLLWNDVPSFDLRRKVDVNQAPAAITLRLDRPASITLTRLGPDAPPPESFAAVTNLAMGVADEVMVAAIRLLEPLQPSPLDPPANIAVNAGPTSVELAWPASPRAEAYWVTLNDRTLGRALQAPDGKARFRMESLIPALTYRFQIVAAARDGAVSAPVTVAATTVDAFPDLTVRSLRTLPESPREGDTVTFEAEIENRGNAAVEVGTTLGTKFQVDGKTVCWCDSLRGPLGPGQRALARPNNGPTGATTFAMTRGCHLVTALVDDVNRIIESDEANNTRTITISSGTGPDLVVREAKPHAAVQAGGPLVVEVTLSNQGTEPIPAGTRVSASVYTIDTKPRTLLGYAITQAGLPAGGSLTLTITCSTSLAPGKHALAVMADDVNRVAETEEANNTTNLDVDIGAAP